MLKKSIWYYDATLQTGRGSVYLNHFCELHWDSCSSCAKYCVNALGNEKNITRYDYLWKTYLLAKVRDKCPEIRKNSEDGVG